MVSNKGIDCLKFDMIYFDPPRIHRCLLQRSQIGSRVLIVQLVVIPVARHLLTIFLERQLSLLQLVEASGQGTIICATDTQTSARRSSHIIIIIIVLLFSGRIRHNNPRGCRTIIFFLACLPAQSSRIRQQRRPGVLTAQRKQHCRLGLLADEIIARCRTMMRILRS